MEVTDVRVTLMERGDCPDRFLGYASILIDGGLVVKNLRIIDGDDGAFVAFPQERITDRCPACNARTPLVDRYCGRCGGRLDEGRCGSRRDNWRSVCHPVSQAAREAITSAVIEAYYDAVAEAQAAAPKEVAHVA